MRCRGWGMRKGYRAAMLSPHTPLPAPLWVLEPRNSPNLSMVFKDVPLYRHNWVNYWPLATELSLRPSPLPGGLGEEGRSIWLESSSPLMTWLVPLASSPHFEAILGLTESSHQRKFGYSWKVLIVNNKTLLSSPCSESSKGFRNSVSGMWNKDQIYTSYYITTSLSVLRF